MWNLSPIVLPLQIQDFNTSTTSYLQRNILGVANQKTELVDLIAKEKPDNLYIQETVLSKQTNFNLKKYNGLLKEGQTNYRAHGGAANFIHETITYQNVIFNTPLQALAARINIGRDMTIVSIHKSRNHAKSKNLSSTLSQKMPKPVILTGDFNSYHHIQGSPANDIRMSGHEFYEQKPNKHFKRPKTHKNIWPLKIGN